MHMRSEHMTAVSVWKPPDTEADAADCERMAMAYGPCVGTGARQGHRGEARTLL